MERDAHDSPHTIHLPLHLLYSIRWLLGRHRCSSGREAALLLAGACLAVALLRAQLRAEFTKTYQPYKAEGVGNERRSPLQYWA